LISNFYVIIKKKKNEPSATATTGAIHKDQRPF